MQEKPTLRIIPRLDIKGGNLVKGVQLEGLRVLGNPAQFAEHYSQEGADEIFYQDVVASLYERNSLESVIRKTAENTCIPVTVSGGIRRIEDISAVLKAGADKVAINTAAFRDLDFIKRAVHKFGASTITICAELIKDEDKQKYFCFTDNGREETGWEICSWIEQIQEIGVGELVLTSVDREGTGEGFDEDLLKLIAPLVEIPLLVHGGISGADEIEKISNLVDGVVIGSIFHYDTIFRLKTFQDHSLKDGNTSFLQKQKRYKRINPIGIQKLKEELSDRGISIRL